MPSAELLRDVKQHGIRLEPAPAKRQKSASSEACDKPGYNEQISSILGQTDAASDQLQTNCHHALLELEKRARADIEKRLHECATVAKRDAKGREVWRSLPEGLRQVLWFRHGPTPLTRAQQVSLARANSADDMAAGGGDNEVLEQTVARFVPLSRLAQRTAGWQRLLGVADSAESSDVAVCASLARHARAANFVHELANGLIVVLSINPRAGLREGYWEVHVRIECHGAPRSISRVSIVEDLQARYHDTFAELDLADMARVRQIASRDVHLSPPAQLAPGSAVEITIKLPRVPSHLACAEDEAPPELRVTEVVRT